jgi:hypothetical protein
MIKRIQLSAVCVALLCAMPLTQAQSTFQNLDFEAANLSNPSGIYNEVAVGNALPGWSASIGGVAVTQVWADGDSAGEAAIDVEGPSVNAGGIGPLGGNYSVYLQSGANPQGGGDGVSVSLFQTGTIPANAASLLFKAWNQLPAASFSVSFGGNSLSPVVLSSGQTASGQIYSVYGVNIASYAGQTELLEFTSIFTGLSQSCTELDDINFSANAVPEPSTLVLFVTGSIALAARRWRKKGSTW